MIGTPGITVMENIIKKIRKVAVTMNFNLTIKYSQPIAALLLL